MPLAWTNQISAQTFASKTLTIIRPPAPVSEMERSRVALITLMCVWISNISGLVVEMRVKPGDDATIYCDCPRSARYTVIWLRKSSHNLEPPLIHFTEDSELPRYSFEWNSSSLTYDLLVENITESDLGLYYCALNTSGGRLPDVYYEGNRTTFLSFLVNVAQDCNLCWKLLISACPACVLLASVVSSTCVCCICRNRTKADGAAERRGNMEMRNHDEVEDDEDEYDDFEDSVDIPSNEQTDLKKGTAEDSDLIYSELARPSLVSSLNNKSNRYAVGRDGNRNVPLTLTNQNSAQTSASKTLTITSPPAPVSEMETLRVALITLVCVWFSRISGEEVEMKVRPGDDAVFYCDCNWKSEFSTVWFRKSSHEHTVFHGEAHPRYITVRNLFSRTSDLLVRNVSESDLGLYYCALLKIQPIRDKARACSGEDVCLYGNRTTRLSFHGKIRLLLYQTVVSAGSC
ncbi:hypothetical protein NFI96_030785, partial [Prochilodus magdalenae]